jgi:hypothetical protein
MGLHVGGGLPSSCLNSFGCVGCWRTLDSLGTFFMMSTWRLIACLREHLAMDEEHLAFQRRVLSPKQHGVAHMLTWRHGVGLGTLVL